MREPFSSGVVEKCLRLCSFVLPIVLAFGAVAASAQQMAVADENMRQQPPSIVGQWRGYHSGSVITIAIQPSGQYVETLQSPAVVTQVSGPYRLIAPNTIILEVTSWAPKTTTVYRPSGTMGGYYMQEPMAKPSGGADTYVFKGPNKLVLTDQMLQAPVAMTRVR